jgi:hypothetical protein
MSSTYSTNLALELIGTGDQAGNWGSTTNTNLGTLLEQAISGYVTQAVSTGATTTITIPNGATGVARNMFIELTGTGGASTNLVVPANKKLYFIYNNTTGAVTVKVTGLTGVSVPAAAKMVLVSNGTDIVVAENYLASLTLGAALPVLSGGTGVTTSTGSGANVLATSPTLVTPILGTPTSGTLTNCTFPTLNQNTTGTAAGLSVTLAVASGGTGVTTSTGTGSTVLSASPTFTGTPLAPTASPGTNTTQIATTAFVTAATGTLGTMSTQNANNVAITGGTISGLSSLGVSGTATATTFSGAGTSLTGTAAALSIGGNAATATNATNATNATTATTATTATNATNILGNSTQTYQNVTGSRAYSTTYTNSTGKPIWVWYSSDQPRAGAITRAYVNGALACYTHMDLYPRAFACFIVPISGTYYIDSGSNLDYWIELR